MEIIKNILTLFLILIPQMASACPSCALSNNGRFFNQTLIAVGIMWLLPIVIAGGIGIKIYFMCKNPSSVHEKSPA